ncbi:hypothetical protein, partial [Corynebacterium sp.]|uniref:hypothetical protein n=1 Tax=Corynebacterium sp. TaxID=1720 RepID=UPI0026DFEC17
GLGDPIDEPFYDGNRSAMCSFTALDEQRYPGVFSLVGDRNSKAKLEEQGLILGDMSTGIVPGGYLHLMPNDIENNCSAAVHTNRGRLIVRYTEVLSERDRQHYCDVASATLNSIYNQLGEIHGRFHRP